MPALYPSMVAPECFKPGQSVRKFVTEWNVTPYLGVVTHVVPATSKVWVQWPFGNQSEDPEYLIKVNPLVSGMPTAIIDRGYSSYEKSLSEKAYGAIPRRKIPSRDCIKPLVITARDKMAIRVAHTFATKTIGALVDDIESCLKNGMTDVQTYNKIFNRYGTICSDYIIQSSIKKIYEI